MRPHLKRLFSGLAISVGALLLMGVVGEVILRVDFAIRNPPLYPSPTGIRLNPNSEGVVDGTWVTINAHGMRDTRDYAIPKPDGVMRIAVIGDSVTFGTGVELEDTYAKQLETALNANDGPTVEVLNFGVPGTNTPHHIAMIDQAGRFDPDVIVLAYVLNDAAPTPESSLGGGAGSVQARAFRWVKTQAKRSFLVQFILEKSNIAAYAWRVRQESARQELATPLAIQETGDASVAATVEVAGSEPVPQLDSFVLDALSWYTEGPGSVWQSNRPYLETFVRQVQETDAAFVMVIVPLE